MEYTLAGEILGGGGWGDSDGDKKKKEHKIV